MHVNSLPIATLAYLSGALCSAPHSEERRNHKLIHDGCVISCTENSKEMIKSTLNNLIDLELLVRRNGEQTRSVLPNFAIEKYKLRNEASDPKGDLIVTLRVPKEDVSIEEFILRISKRLKSPSCFMTVEWHPLEKDEIIKNDIIRHGIFRPAKSSANAFSLKPHDSEISFKREFDFHNIAITFRLKSFKPVQD